MTDQPSAEDFREAREWLRTISFHHYNWHEKDVQSLAAEFARVRREAVAGAVEACAKAICKHCQDGIPLEFCGVYEGDPHPHWYHRFVHGAYDGKSDLMDRCSAHPIHSLTPADAAAEIERIKTSVEAETIMRFRKMLDRIGIHGYYNEMQKEFGGED